MAERARARREQGKAPSRDRPGRALAVWTAIGTVLAGLVAVPALLISLNALRISEEQRLETHRQFAQRVTLPDDIEDQFFDNTELTISNANTIPVAVEMLMPGPIGQRAEVIYDTNVPACAEVAYHFELIMPFSFGAPGQWSQRVVALIPLTGIGGS
ncbi:hypothetical protein ACIBH1_44545 [Nonomuraea sp. NPDC050663]|uniref:hypothetical protein n=1 Tax=Nonomuraea sp. NPDC050663 TaxID=3364370 RepID=UPI0037A326FB